MANIEVDGPNKTIKVDSGDLTFDIPGDIVLDAGGADIIFKDDGTSIAHLTNSSSDLIVESKVSDKDIIFKVNDGGSATEVARFDGDVSAFKIASGKKLMLGAAEEYISGDGTDITFAVGSSGDINIPADIGLTFGDDGEKIEGDGTDLTISANNLIIDAAADITLDAAGNNLTFKSGGTSILDIVNSSSDVVIKPMVDAKDIIFQQYDGTEVARIEDNATFNVSSAGKFAYAGTAVTATAAELNILDGVTATAAEINLIDGGTARGTTAIADGDGVLINDAGTMRMTNVTTLKTYIGGEDSDHYFAAKGDGTQTISTGTDTTCEFDVLIDSMDSHSGFNTGTYTYTVQTGGAGLWYLKFGNYFNSAGSWGSGEQIQMQLYGLGMNNHIFHSGTADGWLEVNGIVKLDVGDTVKGVVWQNTGGNVTANNNNGNAIIGGFRVKSI